MALEDLLLPSEHIVYKTPDLVNVRQTKYRLYLTNQRVILHRVDGLFFKKDDLISWRTSDITHTKFKQEGLLGRRGRLDIEAHGSATRIEGSFSSIQGAYMQALAGSKLGVPSNL